MLAVNVTWNLRAVAAVYLLRIVAGILLVHGVYPLFFQPGSTVIELTDRILVILLVWMILRKSRSSFKEAGLSLQQIGRQLVLGLLAGVVLLTVSTFSERLYSEFLFLTPQPHPLLVQIANAVTWQDLIVPLLLATVAAPIAEEILYRLFTFLPLKERFGLWGGAFLSAGIFALMHFQIFWLAETIVVGIGLALLFYFSGSLLSSIIAHSLINSGKIFLFLYGLQ